MKKLSVLISLSVLAVLSSANEPQALQFDVHAVLNKVVSLNEGVHISEPETYVVEVTWTLKNVGNKDIIVPTSSYDGQPRIASSDDRYLCLAINVGRRGNFTPSPLRFFPVILKPGESTELPDFEWRIQDPFIPRRVLAFYKVEEKYARRQGWWFGEVEKEVEVVVPPNLKETSIKKKLNHTAEPVSPSRAGSP